MEEQGPILSTRVAVQYEGDVLLLRRHEDSKNLAGFWEFPGGGMQDGESAVLAGHREVLEETGQDIEMLTFAPLILIDRIINNGTHLSKIIRSHGLMGLAQSNVVIPSPEHSEHCWVDPRAVGKLEDVTIDTKLVAEKLAWLMGIKL